MEYKITILIYKVMGIRTALLLSILPVIARRYDEAISHYFPSIQYTKQSPNVRKDCFVPRNDGILIIPTINAKTVYNQPKKPTNKNK